MPNGPFPWFNPQTPKIQDHHLPINLPTFFTLTSIHIVTFFERSLSGWGRAASNPKWFEVASGLICCNPFQFECQHFGVVAGDFEVDIYPWENDIFIVLRPG
jgi:hypothetical protein